MVIRRESGVLKRVRATPLPPATYLLAVLVSTFVVFLIEAALMIVLGRALFSVGAARPARSRCFATLLIGAAAFAAMGLGLTGFVRSAEGSSAVVNFVYLPMAIISGTFFSPEKYPLVPARDRDRAAADVLHGADPRRDGRQPSRLVGRAARSPSSCVGRRRARSPRSAASAGSRARVRCATRMRPAAFTR